MDSQLTRRLASLPPYLFSKIDAAKQAARAAGVDVVDLGVGDPDRPTPAALIAAMAEAVGRAANHRYPSNQGSAPLREAIAGWLARRHGVQVDPATQLQVLIGSKEGIAHLPLALSDHGDNVLVPDLGYPVYTEATILAGAEARSYPLRAQRAFVVDPEDLRRRCDQRTRLIFTNYPNNPTGAVADPGLWREVVAVSRDCGAVLVNDAAYLEVTLDGSRPASLLACCDPDTDRVIELHSLSKMFNMTGWRIGFAAGHPGVIAALGRVKESVDSGVFTAVQEVATLALGDAFDDLLDGVLAVYPPRRQRILAALAEVGVEVLPTEATFYIWARVPGGDDSLAFCARVLDEIGVVITPGVGFGPGGEGWFRISLTADDERIAAAAERIVGTPRLWRA